MGLGSWCALGIGAVVAVLLILVGLVSQVMIPLAMAIVIAAVLVPAADWLERHRVPRFAGAALVLVLGIALVVAVAAMVIGGIAEQGDEIWARLDAGLNDATDSAGGSSADASTVQDAARDVVHVLTSGVLSSLAHAIGALAVSSVLAIFMLLFLLKDWSEIVGWAVRRLPTSSATGLRIVDSVVHAFRAYVKALTLLGVANGLVVGLAAWALGLPLVGTIAVVSFVTSYVPYLGAFVAGAFAVLVAYGDGGAGTAMIMLIAVLLANGLLQNIVEPFAFGRYLRLHPLAVLILVTTASILFGAFGAILIVPLASAVINAKDELQRAGAVAEMAPAPVA